jgi:CheY-like chemotaxis protein
MAEAEPNRALTRQVVHELRNALSPLASCVDLARARGFDPETSRLLAEKVERALRRAQGILDGLVHAGQAEAERRETASPEPGKRRPAGPMGPAGGGNRILIVDDSAEVRRAYRDALVALGCTVTEAGDAEEALSAVEDDPPDVALIDIHLPGVNGYRLAQTIRWRSGAAIRLVMLSGMTLDAATRDLAREAGFDDCLDKMAGPIALRELIGSSIARKA